VSFPSYGFVLSVRPDHVDAVLARFEDRGLSCAAVGQVHPGTKVTLRHLGDEALLWDLSAQPFITAGVTAGVTAKVEQGHG
jgi:selenophosphate synthetase-related protein